MGAISLVHLIVGAHHQRMLHAQNFRVAQQIPAHIFGFVVKPAVGIGATGNHARAGIHRRYAHLIVVIAPLIPAQGEPGAPLIIKLPVIVGIQRFVMAPCVIGFVIQTIFIADIDRLAVDKGRAAIVGNVITVVGIAD